MQTQPCYPCICPLYVAHISNDELVINDATKTVKRNGKEIPLTKKEYQLLALLHNSPGKVFSKIEIMDRVWDVSFDTGTNTVEVYLCFLRNKIDKGYDKKLILTKPGFGYYYSK